jgi:hypothetical protein
LFLGLFIISYFYGYGACTQINMQMDAAPARLYSAPIVEKALLAGRNTTYRLALAPWGPDRKTETVEVDQPFFDSVKVGDPVCITAHDGELQAAWHTVHRCP